MSRTVARRATLLLEALEASSILRARQKICGFSRFLQSQEIKLRGGSQVYMAVYAPNSLIMFSGGNDIYGAVVGHTIADSNGTKVTQTCI